MDKSDIEKFRRNIGAGETVKIGEDSFHFKPLPLKHLPELMEFGKIISEQGENALMQKDNAAKLFEILKLFVINSYPDLGKQENEDLLDGFIKDNMELIQLVLMRTSIPKSTNQEKLDKIKDLIK